MEELISGMVAKVGIDRSTAEKVVAYLKENASKLPALLGSSGKDTVKDAAAKAGPALGGGLDSMLGRDKQR